MKYEIRLTDTAKADLCDIYDYIAIDLQSPKTAQGLLSRLEEAIKKLDSMPERFRAYEKEPWHSRGLRVMPFEHYIVYYVPNTENHTVTVIRVMYGGRDTESQLK